MEGFNQKQLVLLAESEWRGLLVLQTIVGVFIEFSFLTERESQTQNPAFLMILFKVHFPGTALA